MGGGLWGPPWQPEPFSPCAVCGCGWLPLPSQRTRPQMAAPWQEHVPARPARPPSCTGRARRRLWSVCKLSLGRLPCVLVPRTLLLAAGLRCRFSAWLLLSLSPRSSPRTRPQVHSVRAPLVTQSRGSASRRTRCLSLQGPPHPPSSLAAPRRAWVSGTLAGYHPPTGTSQSGDREPSSGVAWLALWLTWVLGGTGRPPLSQEKTASCWEPSPPSSRGPGRPDLLCLHVRMALGLGGCPSVSKMPFLARKFPCDKVTNFSTSGILSPVAMGAWPCQPPVGCRLLALSLLSGCVAAPSQGSGHCPTAAAHRADPGVAARSPKGPTVPGRGPSPLQGSSSLCPLARQVCCLGPRPSLLLFRAPRADGAETPGEDSVGPSIGATSPTSPALNKTCAYQNLPLRKLHPSHRPVAPQKRAAGGAESGGSGPGASAQPLALPGGTLSAQPGIRPS